jgi:hypothetical protein
MISLIETKHTNPTCMGYTRGIKALDIACFWDKIFFLNISICLGLLYTVVFVYSSLEVHYFTEEHYIISTCSVQSPPRGGRKSNRDPYLAVDTRAKNS